MPVKDLVKQFESSSVSPVSEGHTRTPSPRVRRHTAALNSTTPSPSPSPARFIQHPLLQRRSLPPPRTPPSAARTPPTSRAPYAEEDSSTVPPRSSVLNAIPVESPTTASPLETKDAPGSSKLNSRESAMPIRSAQRDESVDMRSSISLTQALPHERESRSRMTQRAIIENVPESSAPRMRSTLVSPDLSAPESNKLSQDKTDRHSIQKDPFSLSNHVVAASFNDRRSPDPVVPPAYSAFQEGASSKPSSYASTSSPSSHTFYEEFPLRPFSRTIHAHDDDIMTSRPPSPSATLVSHRTLAPHVPIAAKTVFSRGSAPLSLPPLDDYLSSLPPLTFSPFPSRTPISKGKQRDTGMFPPMDRLAATGRTLEDLEKNATIQPFWRNRATIFGSLVNVVIGTMGSSAMASYYSLQGLYDGLQLFALLLSTIVPHGGKDVSDKWRKLFLGTIPNVLALNITTSLLESFILLIVLMAISGLLLYYFHVSTTRIGLASSREGLQGKDTQAGWGIVFASFTLTLVYLPLSTIAVHALLWSEDFWVVPNPYINATTLPPDIPPLGPSSEFRDSLDFCFTTTMRKNEANFAPALVILAALTFIFLTVWFPIRLAKVISQAVPRVDRYTEFGKRRSRVESDHEYERLLDRDKNPFNFLYKDLRMGWGTYKSAYLFVKLSTLLIVAVLDSNNCVFRNSNSYTVSIVRQAILVLAMSAFLLIQSFLTPFLDPVNNASEWISRAGYVAFAVIGLTAALKLPASLQNAFNGPILYIVYIINYGFTFYFLIINLSWTRRLVKKLSHRIDFSIDIFSPHLDLSKNSRHTRRRIWQETISVLLLTNHECSIPKSQTMEFSESQASQWPPYLLAFQGSPAERHVENLKILREVGGLAYAKGVALHSGRYAERMKRVQEKIQRYFVGPDSYWKVSPQTGAQSGSFGNAWYIPFPPTVVLRYDSGELVVLDKLHELEEYVFQNEDIAVQEKRNIRVALRALDGHIVTWPYTHTQLVGARSCCWGRGYAAQTTVHYDSCVFSIGRRGSLLWKGVQLGSGFDVRLTYTRNVQADGALIGLDADFDLTPQLAQFLALNKDLIHERLHSIDSAICDYRRRTRRDARAKCDALTYDFLGTVYCSPKDAHQLVKILSEQEKDLRVRQTFLENDAALISARERMDFVHRSEATAWWYLYWDDFWRRNHDTITALGTFAADFDPHYPTSIAYRPLPRAALETFLAQRGLFHKSGRRKDFIHSGVLNKLYFRLNQIVFRGSEKAIAFHLGDASFEVDLEDLEFTSHPKTSSLGTGGGTDHDDVSIRARPFYRWEAIYEDPLTTGPGRRYRRWLPKLAVWFGLSPFWKSRVALTHGVSLDVRLEDGSYVLLESAVNELKEKVV